MKRHPVFANSALSRRTALGRAATVAAAAGLGKVDRVGAQDATPMPPREEREVVYGTIAGEDLLLDVARPPDRAEPRPAVILVHGGGLVDPGPDRFSFKDASLALAAAGYVTFNIDYRLFSLFKGTNPWPAQLDDVQRAVRWVRANAAAYGVNPERIGAFGMSSGGQLVGFLGTRDTRDNSDPALAGFSSRATCVVALAGNFDMTTPNSIPSEAEIDKAVLGDNPDAAAYRDYSPITFVDASSAPFLILQEGIDDIVPAAQAGLMVTALQAAGVQVSYSWFPKYDHFSWLSWASEAPETLAFFGRHLRPDE
jgi:acetyl esterase/lipase